ncbi:MAG: hypothetical protein FWB99_02680 [Treponema sp.]|nr:hypothetical protein [Treponema sp.]
MTQTNETDATPLADRFEQAMNNSEETARRAAFTRAAAMSSTTRLLTVRK